LPWGLLFGLYGFDKKYRVFGSQIDGSWKWSVICTRSADIREYVIKE